MHMHTLKVAILERATRRSTSSAFVERADRPARPAAAVRSAGCCRCRSRLNHPLWITDRRDRPGAAHLPRTRLPAPGGMAELEQLIGADRQHPARPRRCRCGSCTSARGCADGRVAVVGKMHHALADGDAANALLGNVTDAAPRPSAVPSTGRSSGTPSRAAAGPARRSRDAVAAGAVTLPALLWRTPAGRGRRSSSIRRGSDVARAAPGPRRARAPRSTGRSARGATSRPRRCRWPRSRRSGTRTASRSTTWCSRVVVGRPAPRGWTTTASSPSRLADRRRARSAPTPPGLRAAARRQPGLEPVHHAGHRRRRPARAAADRSPGPPTRVQARAARRSAPTCSSTGCSSPRRRRSARSCGSTRGSGPPRGTRPPFNVVVSNVRRPARASCTHRRRPARATCSASARSSRASGST